MVPARALTVDPAGNTAVITAVNGGKPVYQRVETGSDSGKQIEITSGLDAGEKVYFVDKGYKPQQAEGGNPLMPGRPNMNRQQQRAVRGH